MKENCQQMDKEKIRRRKEIIGKTVLEYDLKLIESSGSSKFDVEEGLIVEKFVFEGVDFRYSRMRYVVEVKRDPETFEVVCIGDKYDD